MILIQIQIENANRKGLIIHMVKLCQCGKIKTPICRVFVLMPRSLPYFPD